MLTRIKNQKFNVRTYSCTAGPLTEFDWQVQRRPANYLKHTSKEPHKHREPVAPPPTSDFCNREVRSHYTEFNALTIELWDRLYIYIYLLYIWRGFGHSKLIYFVMLLVQLLHWLQYVLKFIYIISASQGISLNLVYALLPLSPRMLPNAVKGNCSPSENMYFLISFK